MRGLYRSEIERALECLGREAAERNLTIELVVVGGAAMALAFHARNTTRDVDAVFVAPEASIVRPLVVKVAHELKLPSDWLNDAAKGYLHGLSETTDLLVSKGIRARMPSSAQLLAMKLCAWRDDVDIADSRLLLKRLIAAGYDREDAWAAVEPYLLPGRELKAKYAFEDLWESKSD